MQVGIIGAGVLGAVLGSRLTAQHEVVFGVRSDRYPPTPGATVAPVPEALASDVVILAVPWAAVAGLCRRHRRLLHERVVIDPTLGLGHRQLDRFDVLAAAGARYVRAFSTQGPEILRNPIVQDLAVDQYYTSDDAEADRAARTLIADVGMRPVRIGDHTCRDGVDAATRLWFALCVKGPYPVRSGLRFLTSSPGGLIQDPRHPGAPPGRPMPPVSELEPAGGAGAARPGSTGATGRDRRRRP